MAAATSNVAAADPGARAACAAAARALAKGDAAEARRQLAQASSDKTLAADVALLESRAAQLEGDFDAMLAAARAAFQAGNARPDIRFRYLECLLYCGRADEVRAALPGFVRDAAGDHRALARLAEFHVHCLDHAGALHCLDEALALDPANPDYLFSRSASEIALGKLVEAEATLDRVIERRPGDSDAWRNRSTLRRQSPTDNHVAALEEQLETVDSRGPHEAQLCYALAKEYEDLGESAKSFEYLQRGARSRRKRLAYRAEHDLEVMQALREHFDADCINSGQGGFAERGPTFVLGLPRSGTTLVERILSSHSDVESLGEVNDFAFSLMHVLGRAGSKTDLVQRAAGMDHAALGRRYWQGMRNYGFDAPRLIDKTPLNYLYLGLIRLALPNAKVVHVRRAPMDSCYGMYRTLFRAGYPFSYDLDDLARYYIAWHELMQHWREVLGDWYLELSYERLVADQEGETRRLLAHCGLDWQPACLAFHENPSAVATASSAQVRQPVYRGAVGRWRRYKSQLAPLVEQLRSAGIEPGGDA